MVYFVGGGAAIFQSLSYTTGRRVGGGAGHSATNHAFHSDTHAIGAYAPDRTQLARDRAVELLGEKMV